MSLQAQGPVFSTCTSMIAAGLPLVLRLVKGAILEKECLGFLKWYVKRLRSMKTGLTQLLENPSKWLKGRAGLIANPTTVNPSLLHAADLLPWSRLFGPEHGIRGDAQYMVEVADALDAKTGVEVVSLYGRDETSLKPKSEHLQDLDVLVFDIQDIGTRYYTYAATMALAMQAAREAGIRFVVLDRPNPIGGLQIEGGGIAQGLENFCGLYPVPQRHGLTVGELAQLYNTAFGIGCELEVIQCSGWQRSQYYDQTGLPWVLPSPNMPTLDTALVYSGMCLLEGTNISEGRGTTRPFELFGAPFIDSDKLAAQLKDLPGLALRACNFTPTFEKFKGQLCHGLQLHVLSRKTFLPLRTGIAILIALRQLWPNEFKWRTGVYEFRQDVPAIDLLTGFSQVREAIDAGEDLDVVMELIEQGREVFDANRNEVLLY